MYLSEILSVIVSPTVINNEVNLDGLGRIIKSLIEGCGSIGLGVIVFTLILKLITLPFDIYSRVSTKKNAIKMEKLRPELEKLQRTYSRNQELYNQKMQELYRKNNYSPFSACLPTLLNLVIFFIAIGQFSTYSNYANLEVFCDMSKAYSQAVFSYDEINQTQYFCIPDESDGEEHLDVKYLDLNYFYNHESKYNLKNSFNFTVTENKGYNATFTLDVTSENIKLIADEIAKGEKGALNEYGFNENPEYDAIRVDENGVYSFIKENLSEEENVEDATLMAEFCNKIVDHYAKQFIQEEVNGLGRKAAADNYYEHDLRFLWVKNIWCEDLPWVHPVKDTFASYSFVRESGCGASCKASCNKENLTIDTVSEDYFAELTANLAEEKSKPNGYLILVVLSIGTMLISQLLAQKQNKTQMELSSVDGANGTAAQSQKMMMWMMPIMFGVFSFMYTASFSVYIVVSSLFSLAANAIINKLVEKKFEKLAAQEAYEMELKRTGRLKELEELQNKKKKK